MLLIVGLVAAMTGVSPAGATLDGGSPFDGTDGLLDVDNAGDPGIDATNSKTDNSYTQGAAENDTCPAVSGGSIPPSKADLYKFWGAALEGSGGDTFLYLAWERTDTNGTATMDFELNQSSAATCNGVNPPRTEGDLLISYNFKGGQIENIEIRTWDGSKWGDAVTIDPSDSSFVEVSISADLTFGELVINLDEAGIFTEGECVSFASVFLKTRSSDSFPSELKDLIAPIPHSVSNCGSLAVTKTVLGGAEGDSFDFTVDCGDVDLAVDDASFSLEDGGAKTILDVPLEASCTVTETVPGASGNWTTTYQVDLGTVTSGRSTTVSIVANDTRTVAFTNTRVTGELTISKVTSGGSGLDVFTFHVECDGDLYDQDVLITDTDDVTISGIPVGTSCTVEEEPDGLFTSVRVSASDTVIIDSSDQTLRFTNTRKTGGLTVSKTTNADGTFVFDVDCDPEGFDQVITIENSGAATILGIPTGTSCTVTERDNPLFSSEVIPEDGGPVVIGTGGQTVAFTNTRNTGPLTVTKTAIGGTGTFTFDVDCNDNGFDQVLTITGSGAQTITGIPTTTSCTVTERSNPLFTTSVEPGNGTVSIDAGGANVAFTNIAKPNGITLDKKVNGGDHATAADALLAHTLDPLTYTVVITNNGQVPLTITAMSDSLYVAFHAACPQAVGSQLAPGASFTGTYEVSPAVTPTTWPSVTGRYTASTGTCPTPTAPSSTSSPRSSRSSRPSTTRIPPDVRADRDLHLRRHQPR